ncbi:MAG: peptidase [Oceanicaulis sp.]|uniref:proteasome-type protease n=1 Tax=Oceanicaulis TaxID=153232 RepID=UPI000C0A3260|nr:MULTISPECIES: proteasome-type protease [Oceanicaulis]MAP48773.1 peptidase [Oceanicaulis sp.]HCR66747.1 peptidase [Oceanicaulis sp.]|tara:strand:+ start:1233 stop:1964 length:732 start_codon:yes stop_codon:yes gene_type:complete
MTYCVGMRIDKGLVFMSDTRTNAGIDNVSTFKKMFAWSTPGERVIVIQTAGNLATTQAVISLLEERMKAPADRNPGILEVPTMFQVAKLVGDTLKEVVAAQSGQGPVADSAFSATIIVGGQIAGSEPRLFLVYPEGNFIEASDETPYFQIGETKYGRPILLRGYEPQMDFTDTVKLLMLSFESTLRANLSVGMPLDLLTYEADSLTLGQERRITSDDTYFQAIAEAWSDSIKASIKALPDYKF